LQYDGKNLDARQISFNEIEFHMLIKLLMTSYFHPLGKDTNRFVGQHDCYLHIIGNDKKHVCLKISLNEDAQHKNLFYVSGEANTFIKVTKSIEKLKHRYEPYYQMRLATDGVTPVFSQIKPSAIGEKKGLFRKNSLPDKRTMLDFHDNDRPDETRGYHLSRFITDFTEFIYQFGFSVTYTPYQFEKHVTKKKIEDYKLPWGRLPTIWVYDARQDKKINLDVYIQGFQNVATTATFEQCLDIHDDSQHPVLIFQDVNAEDYKKGQLRFGQSDPYKIIYQNYPNAPKQFVDVRKLDVSKDTRFEVIMNQLFLKYAVLNRVNIYEWLPLIPHPNYMFVRRGIHAGTPYHVAMYIEDGVPEFFNLIHLDEKEKFYVKLEDWGINWDECLEKMCVRRRGDKKQCKTVKDVDSIKPYNVILGKNLFVEVFEHYTPQLFYKHDEILRRKRELNAPHEIDEFKLVPYTDKLLKYPLEILEQYDQYLDDLKRSHAHISFSDLKRLPDISRILGGKRKVERTYNVIGKFLGTREQSVVPLSRGIWYSEDLSYAVGHKDALNSKQPRAHLIRQFIVYQGEKHFDFKAMFDSMSITFIRFRQYTVYPFYFSLVKIYNENLPRHH